MLLVVDIGNTNITLGVYDSNKIKSTFRIPTEKSFSTDMYKKQLFDLLKDFKITKCVVVSVVEELDFILKKSCDEIFNIETFLFTADSKTGVLLDVEQPSSVGADRIANACAAYKKYKTPCIIIDSGTATTFDIISEDGRFFGGVIMPGIGLQLKSLCEKTSKLPLIQPEEINNVIGFNTKTCILSGVIRGHACAIDGLISECEKEIGQSATIIATGGLSSLISKYMKRKIDYIDSNLTLDGIKILYEINVNKC